MIQQHLTAALLEDLGLVLSNPHVNKAVCNSNSKDLTLYFDFHNTRCAHNTCTYVQDKHLQK